MAIYVHKYNINFPFGSFFVFISYKVKYCSLEQKKVIKYMFSVERKRSFSHSLKAMLHKPL